MNFEFSLYCTIIVAAWALVLPLSGLVSVILCGLVFFSGAIPVSILFLLSLNLIALIQAIMGGKKTLNGRTQKRYLVVFLGTFAALVGSAIPNPTLSYPIVFVGLLLTMANAVSSFFFCEHYDGLYLGSFLSSVALPSIAAINILLKLKSGMKTEFAPLWDITLLVLGLLTFLNASVLAVAKRRLKSTFIYICLAWIGLLLYLLVADGELLLNEAFAAVGVSAVTSVVLLDQASRLGRRYFVFAKIAVLALPGAVGFSALFFSLKITFALNSLCLLPLGLGYLMLMVTLIGARANETETDVKLKIRFWCTTVVQFLAGSALLWIDMGGLK